MTKRRTTMKLDLSNLSKVQRQSVTDEDMKDFPLEELDQITDTKEVVPEDVIDMSGIKTEVVDVFQDDIEEQVEDIKQNWFTKTWRGVAMWTWLLIIAVCIAAIAFIFALAPKGDANAETTTTGVVETELQTSLVYNEKLSQAATEVSESPEEAAKQDLIKQASVSGLPFSVAVGQIGGNYLLGATTYYPNDPSKSYIDYSIIAPATESEPLKTDKVKDIEKKLTSNLPNIGDIIKVKDASKVSVKTFEHSGSYTTIIFYDGKPFAYAVTGDDGHSLTHVTSYYVSNVADL